MKRIAIVTRNFSSQGGLERYTHKLVEGILSRGYEVSVICEENQSAFRDPALHVINFPRAPKNLNKCEKLSYYFTKATTAVRKSGPFAVVHSQHFAVENPDIVTFHNHTIAHLSKCGRSWENFVNDLKSTYRTSYKLRDQSDNLLATKAGILIFPSAIMQRDFEDHFDLRKVRDVTSHLVAYPGTDFFAVPASQNTLAQRPFTFLFVGRGYRKKGLDVLLAACSKLVSRGYDFRLVIAGLEQKFGDEIRLITMSLRKYVSYLGFVSSMSELYASAQAIVLPSRVEPFGMAPLEAMSCGVVPIVSAVSGVSEILADKKDALILQNQLDADELTNLMASLIDNSNLTQSLGRQARITASKYNWQQTVNVTVTAYERIIASKTSAVAVSD
jgi:glycosyltransferase involved in cell wall biosynthesis